jgi:Fe-S cluster assembly protein SufD
VLEIERAAPSLLRFVEERDPAPWSELRRAAKKSLDEQGFPTKKTELWRFTSVKPVLSSSAARADSDGFRSSGPDVAAVESLRRALNAPSEVLRARFGTVVRPQHFSALNALAYRDGAYVAIDGVSDEPIELVHEPSDGASFPRVFVHVAAKSRAILLERYRAPDAGLVVPVTEVLLEEGASLEHIRVVEGSSSVHLGEAGVLVERSAHYASRVVGLGGELSRLDLGVRLAGDGATAILDGVYHASSGEHVAHATTIEHAAPKTTSEERYRGVIDGSGHAVFDGTVAVLRSAPGASAHQENRNLLLSDDAVVHSKPHLEIDVDDVKASHGSTVGALDDASIFYLRSRGIGEADARRLLTAAFAGAIFARFGHRPIAERAASLFSRRLGGAVDAAEFLSDDARSSAAEAP